jgi:NADPH:quinone reductase-like Zn-dependent oxidoreductase
MIGRPLGPTAGATAPGTVPAAVVTALGEPPTLGTAPVPVRDATTALIEVTAAALNPFDLWLASGTYPGDAPVTPYVPGAEAVGRVLASDTVPTGTRVWWLSGTGSLAARVVVPDHALVEVPDGVPDEAAASLGVAGTAAWLSLDLADLRPGDDVLVLGATGAVGALAVQAARLGGAGRVVAAARDTGALARIAALGADATVTLPATGTVGELAATLATESGEGYDVVIDPVWGSPVAAAAETAAPGRRIVTLGALAGPTAPFGTAVLARGLTVRAYNGSSVPAEQITRAYRDLAAHAAAGRLTVDVEVLPLTDIATAWARQAASPHCKLVLRPS